MGYTEAIQDGVRCNGELGNKWYYPKCSTCGADVPNWNYKRGVKYKCKKCRIEQQLSDKDRIDNENTEIKEKKFDLALKRILNTYGLKNKKEYIKAADIIHDKLHRHGWFDSTEEIMVAIELVKSKVAARHQVKFGTRYRADFVLPDMKVVLEVDGICYHNKSTRTKEDIRDSLIILALGPDWEAIRITDELINQNISKLIPAIIKIRDKRKEMRSKNGGLLPDWYSDREKQ